MFEAKITEVAIGQIRGLVKPSDKERQAAFDLFIELAIRSALCRFDGSSASERA